MRKPSITSLTRLLLCVVAAASVNGHAWAALPQMPSANYIKNGMFAGSGKSSLDGWTQINPSAPATTGTEGADTYVSAISTDAATVSGIDQSIPINGEWARILLRGNIRVVFQNSAASANGSFIGVAMTWIDNGGHQKPVENAQTWLYTTPGWVEVNQLIDVPQGVTALILAPEVNHSSATAYFKDLSLAAWVSTFDDTFKGSTLDSTRWGITSGKHNVRNGEQQWFTADELTVADNMLRIRAEKKTSNGYPFQSGQVSTITKFQQLYGIFEFQQKLPVVAGAWPAGYLLAWNDDWPPEVDIQELAGDRPEEVFNTNHYSDQYGSHRSSSVNFSGIDFDRNQWHTYTVVWEPGQIAWYSDGIYKGVTGQPYDDVSDVPMYITMNFAVGGFGGDPSGTSWPQDFFTRRVSVLQRADLPLPLYPGEDQEITFPKNIARLSAISCKPTDSLATTWTLVEGPAPVKINDSHSLDTTAEFTAPGMYRFSIKVAKGASMNSAQYLVYVNRAIGKH